MLHVHGPPERRAANQRPDQFLQSLAAQTLEMSYCTLVLKCTLGRPVFAPTSLWHAKLSTDPLIRIVCLKGRAYPDFVIHVYVCGLTVEMHRRVNSTNGSCLHDVVFVHVPGGRVRRLLEKVMNKCSA